MSQSDLILFDAGMFIGALLQGDGRHSEARPLVEAARAGRIGGCTTTGILSEVYAALTWIGAQPTHSPEEAADAVRSLIETPSQIQVLASGLKASLKMLDLAKKYGLKARRTHDARHAAIALEAGITKVYTYDAGDWKAFESGGLVIVGPPSSIKLGVD